MFDILEGHVIQWIPLTAEAGQCCACTMCTNARSSGWSRGLFFRVYMSSVLYIFSCSLWALSIYPSLTLTLTVAKDTWHVTQNPVPRPQHQELSTQNPVPSTQNPDPRTQHQDLSTKYPEPSTQNPEPSTQNPATSTQNPVPRS